MKIRGTLVNKTNEDFDGGMKQMRVGTKGILSKQAGEADARVDTLRAQNGKIFRAEANVDASKTEDGDSEGLQSCLLYTSPSPRDS